MSGPAAAAGFLAITTYRNSWGQIHHAENLASLLCACWRSYRSSGSASRVGGRCDGADRRNLPAGRDCQAAHRWCGVARRRRPAPPDPFDNARKELVGAPRRRSPAG
ncbi:MAG: hypothetical protein R2695_10510 [Acidimicrobiales bacterium]